MPHHVSRIHIQPEPGYQQYQFHYAEQHGVAGKVLWATTANIMLEVSSSESKERP